MLTIIAGKPGSGKSYHMASIAVSSLTDWMRYELKKEEPYPSQIWTNMKFNIDGCNETISNRIGKKVDISHYFRYCDTTFFEVPNWWSTFPEKAFIIIDEVHFHLGKKMDYGKLDVEDAFVKWVSTHRHNQQELYFLTQHTDQFASSILGIADKLVEIVNIKSIDLPWPLSLPMSDIEELKRCFGITTQYYRANIGNFRGKAIKWGGAGEHHLMLSEIFRTYRSASHGSATESSDRPSLDMNWHEGLRWFARKQAWHLVPKLGTIFSLPALVYLVFTTFPSFIMSAVANPKKHESSVIQIDEGTSNEQTNATTPEPRAAVPAEMPSGAPSRAVPGVASQAPTENRGIASSSVSDDTSRAAAPVAASVAAPGTTPVVQQSTPAAGPVRASAVQRTETRIVMLFQDGIMIEGGRRISIGETIEYEGETETLAVACARCGVVGFESGKRLKL